MEKKRNIKAILNPFKKLLILLTISYGFLIFLKGFLGIDVIPWHMSRPFADLITITNTMDCNFIFKNPYLTNMCDPWGRMYNYPRIWLNLFSFFNLGKSSTLYLGFLYIIIFTFSASKLSFRQNNKSILYLFILLISPPILLLLERGNNDLLVFSTIVLTYYGIKENQNLPESIRIFFPVTVFFILGVFKIYPFILITTILFEKISLVKKILFTIVFLLLSVTYLYYIKEDLKLIVKNTPNPHDMAYGRMVKFWIFNCSVELRNKISILLTTIIMILAFITLFIFNKMHFVNIVTNNNSEVWLFICGASIFIGTFMIGNNYIYRIVFLLLCLPHLLSLLKYTKLKYFSIFILIMLVLRFYYTTFEKHLPFKQQFLLDLFLSWVILFSLLTLALYHTIKSIKSKEKI